MFLKIDYSWKNILIEQIQNATHSSEFLEDSYHMNFSVNPSCTAITNIPRVPFSIIIEFGSVNSAEKIYHNQQNISFSNLHQSPIECNLHIVDGYLKVIEIFTLDGTQLHLDNFCNGSKYYLFH
jgi:hypothetical protein